MADAGVPVHVLRMIAGHGDLATDAGAALNRFLTEPWSPNGLQSTTL